MKLIKKYIPILLLALIVGFMTFSPSHAQIANVGDQKTTIPSPTAAALGEYGSHRVNMYSGAPSIGIGLGEIKSGNLALPISMNYNASGVKVKDQAGWTGLGWSLSAGGAITRTVRGLPDSDAVGYLNEGKKLVAYENQMGDSWRYQSQSPSGFIAVLDDIAEEYLDGQPDRYNFNFAGYSGELVLTWQGKAEFVVTPFEKMKVEFDKSGGAINEWTITTPEGTTYTFEEKETTSVVVTGGSDHFDNYDYTSAWYLTSIESANQNHDITLSYASGGETNTYYHSSAQQMLVYPQCQNGIPSGYSATTHNTITSSDIIATKHLDQITAGSSGQTADFANSVRGSNYEMADDRQLNQVTFKKHGNVIRKYNMNYSPAVSGRLTLENIILSDSGGGNTQEWLFDYNTSYTIPSPSAFNTQLDHWGYYNGASGNSNLIPDYQVGSFDYNGADRSPDAQRILTGTLNKITYPTGGYTDFDFEIDQYRDGGTNKNGGGIRLTKMTSNDGMGNTMIKEYTYEKWNQPGVSSGELYDAIDYTDQINLDGDVDCKDDYDIVFSNSIYPRKPTGGAPVGYDEVTEVLKDSQGNVTGYTRKVFNTPASEPDYRLRGELLDTYVYDKNKNLLRSEHYTYSNPNSGSGNPGYEPLPYYTSFENSSDFTTDWETNSSTSLGNVQLSSGGYTYETHLEMTRQGIKIELDNINTATLNIDLSGQEEADLTFWWYETNNTYSAEDGVYLSDNGGNSFTKVYNLDATTSWEKVVISLESQGLELNDSFVIKFQHHGSEPFSSSSFHFDEISVLGTINSSNSILSYGRKVSKEYFDQQDFPSSGYSIVPKIYYHNSLYIVRSYWRELQQKMTRVYDPGDDSKYTQTATDYKYNDPIHAQLTKRTETNSDDQVRSTSYTYASEKEDYSGMESRFMLTQPYKMTLRDGSNNILRIDWTLWKAFNVGGLNLWKPCSRWVGGPGFGTGAPNDPDCD